MHCRLHVTKFFCSESTLSIPLGCSPEVDPWCWGLQRAKDPKLISREIILQLTQAKAILSQYLNVTARRTCVLAADPERHFSIDRVTLAAVTLLTARQTPSQKTNKHILCNYSIYHYQLPLCNAVSPGGEAVITQSSTLHTVTGWAKKVNPP